MNEFVEGDVVITNLGQAGSIAQLTGKDVWVLLRNGDLWVGQIHGIRLPQGKEDLDACPIDVVRAEIKRSIRSVRSED